MNMVFLSIYLGLLLYAESKFSNFIHKDIVHLLLISRYLIIVVCYSKYYLLLEITFSDCYMACKEMLLIFMCTSSNLTELFTFTYRSLSLDILEF